VRSHVALWLPDHAVWGDVRSTYGNWMEVGLQTTTSRPITCRFRCASATCPGRTGVLASAVVPILVDWRVWGQLFEPHFVIMVQATFIVVDKHTRSNVLRIYKGQYPLCGILLSSPCRSLPSRR
jgi:hypothetical protein